MTEREDTTADEPKARPGDVDEAEAGEPEPIPDGPKTDAVPDAGD